MLTSMLNRFKRLLDNRPFFILLLAFSALGAATTQFTTEQMSFRAANLKLRGLSGKLQETRSVTDFPNGSGAIGWTTNGSTDESAAFIAAMASGVGRITVPANASCYNIGTTTISIPSSHTLKGEGLGGAGQGASCIIYTGTGCALLLDSTVGAAVQDLDIRVNSTNAGSRAICLRSTTSAAIFNSIEGVSVRETNAVPRTVGQIAISLDDAGANGIYWNTIRRIRGTGWDTMIRLVGSATQGANANHFDDLLSAATNTAVSLSSFANNNIFNGVLCTRSDATLVTSVTCILVGDDPFNLTFANSFYGVDSDMGAPSVCTTIGTKGAATYWQGECSAGGPVADGNLTIWPSVVYDSLQAFWTINKIKGSPANNGPSNLFLQGGVQVASIDGTVHLGTPANTLKSGVRFDSSVVSRARPFAVADCAAGTLSPTVSSLLANGRYTCATAQNLALPTAQGSGGIVQNMPGGPGVVIVGDEIDFWMHSTAAANFTLVAGTGITLRTNAVVNNASKHVICRVTSIGSGTETMDCYP